MDKIKEVCQIQVGEGFKARVDESGNILIEKEKFVPKAGDITFAISKTGKDVLSIFENSNEGKNNIYCEIYLEDMTYFKGGFTCMISELKGYRLATEEEKNILFDELKKRGLKWNPNTRTLEKIYIPKNGEYIYISTLGTAYIAIYNSELREQNLMLVSCFYSSNSLFSYSLYATVSISTLNISSIRKATKEEINNLDNQISKKNLAWNSDLKILHVIPKIGNMCIFWNLLSENAVIDILERVTSSSFLASKQGFYDKCILYNEELYKKMIRYVKA